MTRPRYRIDATDTGLAIGLTGVTGRQERLLTAFDECQQGRCSCPTDEYEKVASMEVRAVDDRIDIQLTSKPGTRFDDAGIAACLDHTIERDTE